MSTPLRTGRPPGNLKQAGNKLADEATTSPIAEDVIRLGYVVRGMVYGVMGLLAVQLAVGRGGGTTDTQGAIVVLGETPLGGVLLYVILIGLCGYALWSAIRAVLDPEHKGTESKGIVERIGYAISGISYGLLAYATYGLITAGASAARNGAQGAKTQQATASILSNSWGPWVVGIAGSVVIGIGVFQIARGLRPDFPRQFQAYALSASQRTWIDRLGRFGTAARGVVFAMIGLFLFLAAYHHDPRQARGIDGVLAALLHQPEGPWLLGVVALGLVAFGIYSVLSGYWLRLNE